MYINTYISIYICVCIYMCVCVCIYISGKGFMSKVYSDTLPSRKAKISKMKH